MVIILSLTGFALLGTLVFSLAGLFKDSKNIEWQVSWEPVTPYKELYELERLRNSRVKYNFIRD